MKKLQKRDTNKGFWLQYFSSEVDLPFWQEWFNHELHVKALQAGSNSQSDEFTIELGLQAHPINDEFKKDTTRSTNSLFSYQVAKNVGVHVIDLVLNRSSSTFKGYQTSLSDFQESMKKGSSSCGQAHQFCFKLKVLLDIYLTLCLTDNVYTQVEVGLIESPVANIWPEVKVVIDTMSAWMVPFLKIFGIEKRNGLSSFDVCTDSTNDICDLVEEFFIRPPGTCRDVIFG
eukprot:1768543-Ditylum_brightwellii.AAC.1